MTAKPSVESSSWYQFRRYELHLSPRACMRPATSPRLKDELDLPARVLCSRACLNVGNAAHAVRTLDAGPSHVPARPFRRGRHRLCTGSLLASHQTSQRDGNCVACRAISRCALRTRPTNRRPRPDKEVKAKHPDALRSLINPRARRGTNDGATRSRAGCLSATGRQRWGRCISERRDRWFHALRTYERGCATQVHASMAGIALPNPQRAPRLS